MLKIRRLRVYACALFLVVLVVACERRAAAPSVPSEPAATATVRLSSTVVELTGTRPAGQTATSTGTAFAATGTPAPRTATSTATTAGTFTDPFAYCAAVGTIDQADARYTGPKVPESVARAIMRAVNAPASAPLQQFVQASFWRCMDGKVYGCTVGANLPCESKADLSREPNPPMIDFCRQNPQSEFIPAVATGRTTVYSWRCTAGAPAIIRQVSEPDARGFIASLWHQLQPN